MKPEKRLFWVATLKQGLHLRIIAKSDCRARIPIVSAVYDDIFETTSGLARPLAEAVRIEISGANR